MSNSALDNLFLMPTPLPAGSAALPLTSGDRRDFDDALERAFQPAAPQVTTDDSAHLTDARRLARDENGVDARHGKDRVGVLDSRDVLALEDDEHFIVDVGIVVVGAGAEIAARQGGECHHRLRRS